MENRFPGKCWFCGDYVPAGRGDVTRNADTGKWQVHCAPECLPDEDEQNRESYEAHLAREAYLAPKRAAILADYAGDPIGTRQRLWDEVQRTRRYLPQTLDYSDIPAQTAYSEAKWAYEVLPEIGKPDWDRAERIGETDRSTGYYDIWKERVPVTGGDIFIPALNEPLYRASGFHGAYYGAAGGYTDVRVIADNGDGTVIVENTYHHGD